MARLSVSVLAVLLMVVAVVAPGQGATAAPVPPRDFVSGGGETGLYHNISIHADSDSLGGDPGGEVGFAVFVVVGSRVVEARFSGPVTCLNVEGNRAVIGFSPYILGPITAVVVDNGSTRSPADEFGLAPTPTTDCSDPPPEVVTSQLLSGDFIVRDVPSKAQCRDGGWRTYTDAAGQPFKSQGDCIAFALGV